MSDSTDKIASGVILTVLGGACIAAGLFGGAPIAGLFGGIVVVVGVADIAYGVWKRQR